MKFWIALTSSVLAAVVLLSFLPVHGEAAVYRDVLRLHVVAESDSEGDQALKLRVRDAVLACVSPALEDCASHEQALAEVTGRLAEIQRAAEDCVAANGGDCSVTVLLEREFYPRRDYGSAVLPSGTYDSLRILLGEGRGHNWWCVLFPTVCIRFAEADPEPYLAAGFTPGEYRLITGSGGTWKVRFRLLEIASELFEKVRGKEAPSQSPG